MTRIDFYTNAENRLQTACALVARAFRQQMRVALFVPDVQVARSVDRLLWSYKATSFIPHCMAADRLAPDTPVLILGSKDEPDHDELLFNLSTTCPPTFSRFKRLIEIVGREDAERDEARTRWRFYKDRGYEIKHVELDVT